MAISKVKIDEFLELAVQYPVFDVRSPAEYTHAHIPGAFNLPLFNDAERKVVGTIYKQEGREAAIKAGLDYFGPKMRKMVEEVEALVDSKFQTPNSKSHRETSGPNLKSVLVHCWRGGLRSVGVAWLLDLYGFKVYTLVGGYKSFRRWAGQQFENTPSFNILGGYTGSGKTIVLKELEHKGETIIDLEAIAKHKGSAFGDDENDPQPRQEMFENILALQIQKAKLKSQNSPVWLEDESRRIGLANIPDALWLRMRASPLYFIEVPFEERLEYITLEYSKQEKAKLVNAIIRIQKRLGGLDTKNAINHLLENNYKECFRILLRYYDKHYKKSLEQRENLSSLMHPINCDGVDARQNAQKLQVEKTNTQWKQQIQK